MRSFIKAYYIQLQRFIDHVYRSLFGLPQLSRSEITPYLFLGGQYNTPAIKKLEKMGVTGIVSMRKFTIPSLQAQSIFSVLHLPTPDQHAPTIEDLKKGILFMQEEIAKGGKIYVHCRWGEGRGPTMAIAYLMSEGITLDQAITQVKKVRTFVNLTKPQLEQLKKLEQILNHN